MNVSDLSLRDIVSVPVHDGTNVLGRIVSMFEKPAGTVLTVEVETVTGHTWVGGPICVRVVRTENDNRYLVGIGI